jgi:outer membrane receptor for monomeric catechols
MSGTQKRLQIRIIRITVFTDGPKNRENPAMLLLTDLSRTARSRSPLAAAVSVVLGAASPSILHAQDAASSDSSTVLAAAAAEGQASERTTRPNRRRGQTLEEVTVEGQKYRSEISSPKYTAELVNMPQTVVVIPKTVFHEQAAITLSDVLRNTPGITLLAGEGGGASNTAGDSFFMRGFDATNSIFIDGVRDQAAYSRDVFNLDQVEVAKGPSGSYTGRGNASGSVNLVTKTPTDQPLRLMGLSYGSNDHVRGTVDFNQPLSETFLGGTAVRLNAMWQDGGVAGRDEVDHDAWGIAPSLAIGLGADTRLALAAQILRQESTPDYGLPSGGTAGTESHDAAGRPRRPEQLLRHRRRRLRRCRLRQLHRARGARLRAGRDAAQSLALQRQPSPGRDHDDPESGRLRPGHGSRHARAPDQ